MVNRLHVLDIATIAAAEDGVLNDGGALDGCVLEIHKRNGGKSKRAYFRYNGTPFGEKRTERLALGPYDLGLTHLRRMRVTCERLIEEGKSPRRYYDVEQEKQRTAGMTLRQAVAEHFEWAMRTVWNSPHSRSNNEDYRRLYLEPADIMNLPLDAIRVHHLDPSWHPFGSTMAVPAHTCAVCCMAHFNCKSTTRFSPNRTRWRGAKPRRYPGGSGSRWLPRIFPVRHGKSFLTLLLNCARSLSCRIV
jgi:hypothetical protein